MRLNIDVPDEDLPRALRAVASYVKEHQSRLDSVCLPAKKYKELVVGMPAIGVLSVYAERGKLKHSN